MGSSASLISHWNGGPSGWDFPVPTEHIPLQFCEKDKKNGMSISDVIEMLKRRRLDASQHIQDFLDAFSCCCFFSKINEVSKKNNPLFMWGWDRKICPTWSPFVITQQALWCQSMILGTDFSIPPSHSWWILIIYGQPKIGNWLFQNEITSFKIVLDETKVVILIF